MLRIMGGKISVSKEAIPYEPYDPRIKMLGDVKEKDEQLETPRLQSHGYRVIPKDEH
jgi:hypothetical protein